MADLIGGLVSVPDATISGVFPFLQNFPSIRVVSYDYVIHPISLKKEQRILRSKGGHSWKLAFTHLFSSMTVSGDNTLQTIWTFYDNHRNPRTLFYFYDPKESSESIDITGTSATGRYACRFKESQLTFDAVRDRLFTGNFEIVAVDTTKTEVTRLQYYPAKTYRRAESAWLQQAAEPSLCDDDSIIHFCSINRVSTTTGLETYPLRFSTHRYFHNSTFGINPTDTYGLYLPRLLSWSFDQQLNQSDSGEITIDDSDLGVSDYLEQIDIAGWEMKFIIHVNGALGDHGIPVQFWRGYVSEWQRDANQGTITIKFDGAASRLRQLIPHRLVSLSCPLEFNDMPINNTSLAECPYALLGSGGDATKCDKSLAGPNGCVAHGAAMKNYFQGFVVKPSTANGLLPRSGISGLFGRKGYSSTSIAMQTVYGKPIPYIYGVGKQIIDADIFEYRDESEFKVASGIIGEGPIGYANQGVYANAIGQVLLDNLPQHTGYQPVKAYGYRGQDVGTIIDPDFRCSRLAFVSIRTIDEIGLQPTDNPKSASSHRILVEINYGLCGVRTYWWTGDLTLTREAYGGPTLYCYDIFLRALGLRGDSVSLVGGNDDQPRDQLIDVDSFLEAEAFQSQIVDSLTDVGVTEPIWDFRGVLKDQKPAIDWMRDLMLCCPIDIVFSYGKLNFKSRKDDVTTPPATLMLFQQNENIIDKSFSASRFKPAFNSITYSYADEAFDTALQTVTVEDKLAQKRMGIYKLSAGYFGFVPNVMKQQITLPGTFRRSQVIRLATQVLREELGGDTEAEQENARTISFAAPLVGMGVDIGDVFKVIHEEIPDGEGFFRCTQFKYTSDLRCEIVGKTVRASMYGATPAMLATVTTGDPVVGTPGGSMGSTGSINELPALTAPVLTLSGHSYKNDIVSVDAQQYFANYLVVQVSADNAFSAPVETIYVGTTRTYQVSGVAGVDQYTRTKWRRSTTPLEEGPWSNTLTLDFPLVQQSEIEGGAAGHAGAIVLGKAGIPTVGTDVTFKVVMPFNGTWTGWHIKLRDPATGTTTVDVKNNGVTIFSTNPSLSSGQISVDGTTGFATLGFAHGDIISLDYVAVGFPAGSRLSIQLDFVTTL